MMSKLLPINWNNRQQVTALLSYKSSNRNRKHKCSPSYKWKWKRERELEPELSNETLRKESNPIGVVTMRGSHSPARLEEISIYAEVHQSKLATDSPESTINNGNNERYSGVSIKDEIEIFTDVELGNGAHYFIF